MAKRIVPKVTPQHVALWSRFEDASREARSLISVIQAACLHDEGEQLDNAHLWDALQIIDRRVQRMNATFLAAVRS